MRVHHLPSALPWWSRRRAATSPIGHCGTRRASPTSTIGKPSPWRSMKSAPERFHSLDVLRGLAALSVVFWHWQHFFQGGRSVPLERMPLLDGFFPLYAKGWLAVELFFSLSGFVFFWLYSRPIAERAVSGTEFFILRF